MAFILNLIKVISKNFLILFGKIHKIITRTVTYCLSSVIKLFIREFYKVFCFTKFQIKIEKKTLNHKNHILNNIKIIFQANL